MYPFFTPFPSEKVIVKHRYSGFLYTDLKLVFMKRKLPHLIMAGLNMEVCLDNTDRDAYMRDFFVTVPYDCAASTNEAHHQAALQLLDGTFANVVHPENLKHYNGGGL
ncbi:MAG TPA: isochorismatase family protein [Virgibacillus sp.]|nr:isochorismatase family protein [Virgibacillus sp.]